MNFSKLLFLLMKIILSGCLVSCGDDDDFDGRNAPFEIELKIETNASYRGVSLYFFGPDITVDWGDGGNLDTFISNNGSISGTSVDHQYPASTTKSRDGRL